jgi:hypothetical protein
MGIHSMKTLVKRVYPEYFQAIYDGTKPYEIRLGTFKCEVGDILHLKEYDPASGGYTGRETIKVITSAIKTNDLKFWTKAVKNAHGFIIMGLGEPNGE